MFHLAILHLFLFCSLQSFVESGIVKYKLQEGLPNTQICPLDLGNKEKQLQNSDLAMTYLIVGIGFGVSAIIFTIELVIQSCSKDSQTKKKILQKEFQHAFQNSDDYLAKNRKKFNPWADYDDDDDTIPHFPPPPPYHSLFKPPFVESSTGNKEYINGREYWVVKSRGGGTRLVPVRAPSAILYQYTN